MLRYVGTFVGLLVLTTLTLALSYLHLAWETPIALVIAVAKAVLVALFFMELVEQRTTNWVSLVVAVLLACTLIGLALLDVVSRGRIEMRPRIAMAAEAHRDAAGRRLTMAAARAYARAPGRARHRSCREATATRTHRCATPEPRGHQRACNDVWARRLRAVPVGQ